MASSQQSCDFFNMEVLSVAKYKDEELGGAAIVILHTKYFLERAKTLAAFSW